jgi:hypothetical protein
MEIEKIIADIKKRIEHAKEMGYDLEKTSWGDAGYGEEGMLISFNDMQAILDYIEGLKLDMLELRE